MRLLVSAIVLLLCSTLAFAQNSSLPEQKLYAVIFDVTVDASGKVGDLAVAKVIDPASGTTNPVEVEVPESFVRAAHSSLLQRSYSASRKQFYTYIFYDPLQPDRADIDPNAGRL